MSNVGYMKTVYDLRMDAETIASMQRGSPDAGSVGLRMTHGLIGSTEWWAHVDSGSLKNHIREGTISGFWPGQHGGGPAEFQLRQSDGTTSMWLCELEPNDARRELAIGRSVRVTFVVQTLKTQFNGTTDTNVILSISVADAQQIRI